MKARAYCAILLVIALGAGLVAPLSAGAQSALDQASHHRQQTKNQWRNIGIGSAALGLLGLVKGNSALTLAGAAGALYSASRYEHDRKSQSKIDRARASYYGRTSFSYQGKRYVRKTVWKNGHKYYQFVRA